MRGRGPGPPPFLKSNPGVTAICSRAAILNAAGSLPPNLPSRRPLSTSALWADAPQRCSCNACTVHHTIPVYSSPGMAEAMSTTTDHSRLAVASLSDGNSSSKSGSVAAVCSAHTSKPTEQIQRQFGELEPAGDYRAASISGIFCTVKIGHVLSF